MVYSSYRTRQWYLETPNHQNTPPILTIFTGTLISSDSSVTRITARMILRFDIPSHRLPSKWFHLEDSVGKELHIFRSNDHELGESRFHGYTWSKLDSGAESARTTLRETWMVELKWSARVSLSSFSILFSSYCERQRENKQSGHWPPWSVVRESDACCGCFEFLL